MIKQQLQDIEKQLDELTVMCQRLQKQNHELRVREAQLIEERASLVRSNDIAKTKVEAMIMRLKSLEQES